MYQIENYFAPSIGPPGLSVFVEAGVLLVSGSGMIVPATTVTLPANTTSYVYLNTSTAVVTSNTSGYPSSNCYSIATVVTGNTGIVSLIDNRPDVTGTSGGGGGGVTSVGTAGIATGGPITTTGTVTVSGSGSTTTAATANANLAAAPNGDVLISDGSGNVKDSGVLLSAIGGTVTSVAETFTGGLISVAGSPITTSGTFALTVAGTSGGIPYFSSASTWASSAQLPAGDFVLGGGAGNPPTASFSVVPVANGGTGTGSTLTGLVRGSATAFTASEISGDATTSGSNALTLATVNPNVGSFTYASITVNAKGLITAASSGSAPTGTVTSFSAGNLSPLFTTSVATSTTTPALSFSLSNAGGGTVFGNNATTSAAPAYTTAPVLGIPGTSTGTIALASSTASGKYTITAPANAATPTLTLPTATNVLAGEFAGDGVLYSSTPVGSSAAGLLSLPALSTQTANYVFAGPASGAAAAPTFRALVSADIPSGTVLWNQIGNPSGNLTLSVGTYNSTFTGSASATSPYTWLLLNNFTATSSTALSSPTLALEAQYWNGSGSALDEWTFYTFIGPGTNAVSTLEIIHAAGTSGNSFVSYNCTGIQFASSPAYVDFNSNTSWILNFSNNNGGTINGVLGGTSSNFTVKTTVANTYIDIYGHNTTGTSHPAVVLENGANFTATSGTVVGVGIGSASGAGSGLTFDPASGTAAFQACAITPTIEGTSSGNTWALLVNPTLTAANLTGTNLIADFQSGGTSELSIDYSGNVKMQGLVKTYNAIATVSGGIPAEYATVDLTAQTAAISGHALYTPAASGMFRVTWAAAITTADTTASVLGGTNGFQVTFTSPTDSVSKTTVAGNSITSSANTTGTALGGGIVVYAKTGVAMTFSYGYTATTGNMAYELHVKVEAM